MRPRWSKPASQDLTAILEHLQRENPLAATRLVQRLDRILKRMEQFPDAAQEIEQRPGVRRIPFVRYPYVIYYRNFESGVVILRVLHGARDKPWEEL